MKRLKLTPHEIFEHLTGSLLFYHKPFYANKANRFFKDSVCRYWRLSFIISLLIIFPGMTVKSQLVKVAPHATWDTIAKATGYDTLCSVWANPKALSFEAPDINGNIVRKIFINWQTNEDYGPYPYYHGRMSSTNEGATYGPITTDTYCSPYLPGNLSDGNNVDLMSAIKRRDGTIIAVPYRVKYPPVGHQATKKYYFAYNTSSDNGTTWVHHSDDSTDGGTVSFDSTVLGMRFHHGIIEENDGSLYAPVYAFYITDTVWRVVLMKSIDGGVNWNFYSKVQLSPTIDYDETSLIRCANGDWLAVMRSDEHVYVNGKLTKVPLRLKQKRSTNKGLTWGSVIYAPGINADGVNPNLTLMPNGILVLSYGDVAGATGRNVHIAFSTDNGNNWTNDITTFSGVSGVLESTGYTALAPLTAHRLLQITDQGISWSYGSKTPSPNPYAIKQKIIDLVRTQRNRIDLKTKYAQGAITVTSDFPASYDSAHPEARISGAFDGSTDYWSGAFKSGTSGTFTIDLQQAQYLNAIGVCMRVNNAETATVAFSLDSLSWTTVKSYTNIIQQCLDYTDITPIKTRYIRVNVSGADSLLSLNEIELYSIADSYENDAQNLVPDGYTTLPSGGFWVSEGVTPLPTGYQSRRALFMKDADDSRCEITKLTSAETSKTLEFRIRTKAFASYAGAIQWKIVSNSTYAFRMRVTPSGTVQYYDGTSYHTISGITIPADTWTLVSVTANASTGTGTISINGGAAHAIGKETTVSSLNGFSFSSGGAASVGDQALFDDVSFYGASPGSRHAVANEESKPISKLSITASPNPAHGFINLIIENATKGEAGVQFVNALGQVQNFSYKTPGGKLVQRVPINSLAAGMYIIIVKQGNDFAQTKLVVK